ncbi:phosphonate ABC transporter ATP-binding protein [Caldalkalibacillus salinus]|uniref:phosphonate ABC transporter ATP-binding protein n=1 Tax=Caldalkalibacillus salinus TaxID=2803787 RepID=UPI0019223BA8|nr:phosphonate ABC transporter ATP-binding protein [Caldalkalibacillus salinus]
MTLILKELNVSYKTRRREEQALDHVDLTVQEGEFIGILGRSGAGKSTLVRCINQLVRPSSGQVLWNGMDLSTLKGPRLRKVRREIGMVFQQFHLIPRLTVLQNAVLGNFGYRPLYKNIVGYISKEESNRALHALERVGIEHLAQKRVDQLSGGQQQRVAIARVIMQQPKILLGDEPVASLDPTTSKQVLQLMKEIHHTEGMTTIVNLHDVQLALDYCQRIIGLKNGQIIFDGAHDEVTTDVLDEIYA